MSTQKYDPKGKHFDKRLVGPWREPIAKLGLKLYGESGLSKREFSELHAFTRHKLEYWEKRLTHRSESATVEFVPVRITNQVERGAPRPQSHNGSHDDGVMEVVLPGGLLIRPRPGFNAESVSELLSVLES